MKIRIENLDKWYGNFNALKNINLDIPSGKITALLGPSGSGKTTLLRLIAGIEANDGTGKVWFANEDVTRLAAAERKVGFVFQHYALFQHLSILENVAFGLRIRPRKERPSDDAIRKRALELLSLVQLDGLEKRYPRQLSGGQRQRVALARALAVDPRVLLLDEPFGALDAQVRKELRRWLRSLHHDVPLTTLFVTHDQEEALEIADSVVILNKGQIEQIGNPQDVYDHPANPFVYQFLGNVNKISGNLDTDAPTSQTSTSITYVRPHDIDLHRTPVEANALGLLVDSVTRVGPLARIFLQHPETNDIVEVEMSRVMADSLDLSAGQKVYATLRRRRVFNEEYSI